MTEKELQKQAPQDTSGEDDITKFAVIDGGTVVHGVHLVSDKLIGIISETLKLDKCKVNFNVHCIEFKNNGLPEGKVGMAYIDSGSVAINLEEIWSSCLKALEEGKVNLSMTGTIWHELIMTLLHEIHHVFTMQDAEYRILAKEDPVGSEKEAEAWSHEHLIDFAQKFDIEPGSLADMPFFKVKLMELMTSDAKNEEWVQLIRLQIEKGIIYHDKTNDIMTNTFREYLRGIADPGEKDDNWEQGVSVIDLIFNMDDGSVVKTAEVLPEPAVEVLPGPTGVPVEGEDPIPAESEVIVVSAAGEAAVMTDPPKPELESVTPLFAPINTEVDADAAMTMGVHVDPILANQVVENQIANQAPPATESLTESVQLPENIAAEQAQIAAAAVATPATAPPATSYTPNGLSDTTIVAFLKDVYMRLYTHIFNKCGWQLNSDQGFTNPGAVLDPISIADLIQLHQAPGLIMEYDTLDANGHRKPEDCKGHIRGVVFNKSNQHGIPAFAIYLNINGMRVKRSLIAQNPAKITNGQYSSMAVEARAGHAITWLMSEDENKKFVAKIRDNVYEAL